MMEFLYNLKGFVNAEDLKKYSYKNLIFKSISFELPLNFEIEDIHEVECLLKTKNKEKLEVFEGNIFSFSGMVKLSFLFTTSVDSATKIVSKTDNFIFSLPLSKEENVTEPQGFKIDFFIKGNCLFGKLVLVFIKSFDTVNVGNLKGATESVPALSSIDSLFL